MLVVKIFLEPPRFVVYDNKQQKDDQIEASLDSGKLKMKRGSDPEQVKKAKTKGESIKLDDEEVEGGNVDFIQAEGRPENFLGLQDVSSGDQDQKFKYGCTDEMEEALSSLQFNSGQQNRNMFSGSEDMQDLVKGYLKSGKALEGKLNQISSLKHAIQPLEQLHGRHSLNEQPVEFENEEEEKSQLMEGNVETSNRDKND